MEIQFSCPYSEQVYKQRVNRNMAILEEWADERGRNDAEVDAIIEALGPAVGEIYSPDPEIVMDYFSEGWHMAKLGMNSRSIRNTWGHMSRLFVGNEEFVREHSPLFNFMGFMNFDLREKFENLLERIKKLESAKS